MSMKKALAAKKRGGRRVLNPKNRAFKGLAYGDYKSGKTSFACTIVKHFAEEKYEPEQLMFLWLDNDDGLEPLLLDDKKPALPEGYDTETCVHYYLNTSFNDLIKNTDDNLPDVVAHQQEHGLDTGWVIVDNTQTEIEWCRMKMAMDVYGMSEHELAMHMRSGADFNDAGRKKNMPTFDRRNETHIIKGLHRDWIQPIILSGVNVLLLSPEKETWEDNKPTGKYKSAGQPDDPGRVDHLMRFHKKEKGKEKKYFMDLIETRTGRKTFNKMPSPSYTKLRKFLDGEI